MRFGSHRWQKSVVSKRGCEGSQEVNNCSAGYRLQGWGGAGKRCCYYPGAQGLQGAGILNSEKGVWPDKGVSGPGGTGERAKEGSGLYPCGKATVLSAAATVCPKMQGLTHLPAAALISLTGTGEQKGCSFLPLPPTFLPLVPFVGRTYQKAN